jgi:hypothetical protein
MSEQTLDMDIDLAIRELLKQCSDTTPFIADKLHAWMIDLSRTDDPTDYYRHPAAFPLLALPRWFAAATDVPPDRAFELEVVRSSVSGYYYIRLIDNVMDKEATDEKRMLPILSILHTNFTRPYSNLFPFGHPFWSDFESCWFAAAEATVKDAFLQQITLAEFRGICSKKISAARIPILAAAHRYDCILEAAPWLEAIDDLAAWHQMANDLFGWKKDFNTGIKTYFLSEGMRQKDPAKPIEAWVVQGGFDWGAELLESWMTDLKQKVSRLSSPGFESFLAARHAAFLQRSAKVSKGLMGLRSLASAFDSQ